MSNTRRRPGAEAAALAAEAVRHLEWLRDAGVLEVPLPPRLEARGVPGGAAEVPAAAPTATSTETWPVPPTSAPGRTATGKGARGTRPAQRAAPFGSGQYSLRDKGCGSEALLAVRSDLGECTRCTLHAGRTTLVFGVGDPRAELMFVGEGPGGDEDRQGEPFVGKAGQLLTRMIEAMGFRRAEVYIANVVKCRPPQNRDPEPDEIEACEPFLKAQIAAIGPRVIVALGRFAVQTLLRDGTPISRLRGRWREYQGVRLMPTFHPAYLLRNPADKGKAWEDLKLVMKEFGKTPRAR
ncbi:MAG TPA: uracil-DNA glycosylase [Anaeromyxobacteraceae bacterium]|nr:uracil-DNA glycosylase [Anaeromyxobacteraceae bacterium]